MPFPSPRERIAVKSVDSSVVEHLTEQLSVPRVVATILASRGLTTYEECRTFFCPDTTLLHDPFLLRGMETAVERLQAAIEGGEKIVVYGDYDVDGVTAVVLLVRVLRLLGAQCEYYLPNRLTEGYGISADGVDRIADSGATLLVSVDCGVTACEQVAHAREHGLDVVVTDHHETKETLPEALAVIDPKQPGCPYPDKNLAGVGVALKLCTALCDRMGAGEEPWRKCLDLAALGTAADIVPLLGENRVITTLGFEQMADSSVEGICALIAAQGLTGTPLSTRHAVFQIAPCINAVGRLGDPRRGAEMLLTEDPAVAQLYARELVEANGERRAIHQQVEAEAMAWVTKNCDVERDVAIVAADERWHVGVIGIVASKLVERFYRPTILCTVNEDGTVRGSGRSIRGLDLFEALGQCSDLLETFGGHAAAAGVTLKAENVEAFRERFNEVVRDRLGPDDSSPTVVVDAEVMLGQLTPKLFRTLSRMAPFGPGNMRPVLLCRDLSHRFKPKIVGTDHLKMMVCDGGMSMDAIGFSFGDRIEEVTSAPRVSLAFTLDENEWQGRRSLQMKVKGVRV